MALTATQRALVAAFQKEMEDLSMAIVKNMFNIDYGTLSAVIGDNTVTFQVPPYDDINYIDHIEATDANGTDVKAELQITKLTTGMTINCLTACTIRWQTLRQTPKINFWT